MGVISETSPSIPSHDHRALRGPLAVNALPLIRFRHAAGANRDIRCEARLEGGNQRRVTENPFSDWEPSWSPDGHQIVFEPEIRRLNGNRESFVINVDGSNPRNLTNQPDEDTVPAWSNPVLSV